MTSPPSGPADPGSPAIVLAIESSGPGCSAAVCRDGHVIAARRMPLVRGHAAALPPLIEEAVHAAGLDWPAFGAVAVTVGPGSFTGIRVGLAAARGFGLALGVPVLGVTSFEAIAWSVPARARGAGTGGGTLAVLIDSGRGGRFAQAFDPALRPLGEPVALEPAALAGWLPAPPCVVVATGALPAGVVGDRPVIAAAPDAAPLAELASARYAGGGAFLAASALYLRPPDAAVPRDGGQLRPHR